MNRLPTYAPVVIRIALSVLFLWFGFLQLTSPSNWTGFVPEFVAGIVGNASTVVMMNGWFEILAGILLILGIQVRIVALLLALHLFGIAGSIGFTPLGLRDFALAFATLSVSMAGSDICSLDTKFKNKTQTLPQ